MTWDTSEPSEANRSLLEEYLRGQTAKRASKRWVTARRSSGEYPPVSYVQQKLWLDTQRARGVPLYNEALTVHRTGPLDVPALERSLNEIVRRHEAWRTTFDTKDGQLVQIIHAVSDRIALPIIDLCPFPRGERETEALRLATEQTRPPFDFVRGPLIRATLARLDAAEHRLFLTLHQLMFDCASIYTIFLPELAALYDAFSRGRPSPLSDPPIQYGDYACWERQWVESDVVSRQMDYWRKHLGGEPPVLRLPADRPPSAGRTFRVATRPTALPADLVRALATLSQQASVTLFMTLVAAFNTLLYGLTGQLDIRLGTINSSRKHPETQGLLGPFHDTVILRTDLSGNPTFSQLLSRARDVTLDALTYSDVPFHYMAGELWSQHDPERDSVLQVMFVLWTSTPPPNPEWRVTRMDVAPGATNFDLHLDLDHGPDGIAGRFIYNPDLFEPSTIDRLGRKWQKLLEAIVAAPDARLEELAHRLNASAILEDASAPPIAGIPLLDQPEVSPLSGPGSPTDPNGTDTSPRTPVEQTLAEIWTELLGLEQVCVYDNFFDLGGDSRLAVQVIARLQTNLGLKISLSDLMFQTLGQLGAACDERLRRLTIAPNASR
jgi:hypothetical protein